MPIRPKIVPRGIRNNNPLNIRIGNTWLGERANPTDSAFEEFVSMRYGLRAGFLILRRYIRRYKKNTITDIVSTWAPASENNTQRYIDTVASRCKMAPDAPVLFEDKETMVSIVAAMVYVECGQEIDRNEIYEAYDMA